MNPRNPAQVRPSARSGMTLIELTVAILVLLSLLSILFIGARAWKRGSDRAGCIMQIRQVQVAVRSFANLYGYVAGQLVEPLDLQGQVIGPGRFVETTPVCPGTGAYHIEEKNRIPKVGHLYMKCSQGEEEDHQPTGPHRDW